MENRENPLLGRKVFFLNPPLSVENYVIDCLKDEEYEVYAINDVTYAKPVLRLFENAICFIFIDDILSLDGWYNFIKSFESDDTLKSIFLGVISIKTKPKDQERFLMNLKLPGGFVMMDRKLDQVYSQLEGILKINGAKGVRKCLRLDLKDSREVNGYFALGSQLYSIQLVDISKVGFAAVVPAQMAPIFKNNPKIRNISITMGHYSFVCSVDVYNVKIVGDNCVVVATLDELSGKEIKRKIHNFVYEKLEDRMKITIHDMIQDLTDYSIRPKTDEVADGAQTEELPPAEENKEQPQ